ncbi:MAG: IS1634 family transposase [Terriglobia bacterium]
MPFKDFKPYEYLQIVESYREAGCVRQRVRATLGRRDQLVASGALDALLTSLGRFSERFRVVERVRTAGLQAHQAKTWGPALVFGRLWETQGLPAILTRLADGRRVTFDVERATFALALQRLCAPGSDLQGAAWLQTVEAPGVAALELQHLYRTAGGVLAPNREALELALFQQDRDLFTQTLDLVFLDTTSVFVWRDTETPLRRRGYSRDRRPDQPQIVLCVAVDRRGWPVAWDILPGNTADKPAFRAMIERLRTRFRIGRVIVVADRGMMAKTSIELLTGDADAPFDYILGCKLRRDAEVQGDVLARAGRYHAVAPNLEVKEVAVGERRYVVCRNPEEAARDAAARATLVAHLETTLARQGPKALLKNKGFARFLAIRKGSVSLNQAAIDADARLDGKFVLRTNTTLPTAEVAQAYKSLWRVERTFREEKSTLEVRPVYHHRDDTTVGHIVACFLALRLEVDLQRRLDERQVNAAWPDLMRDLGQVQAVEVTCDGQRYRLRTDLQGHAAAAFAAAGVRPPALLTALGPAPPFVETPAPV